MPPGLLHAVTQRLSCTTVTEPKCFALLYAGELLVTFVKVKLITYGAIVNSTKVFNSLPQLSVLGSVKYSTLGSVLIEFGDLLMLRKCLTCST